MSYNATPKVCDMYQNIQPCIISSKEWMKNLHSNMNQIMIKKNKETSNDSKKSHPYIHKWLNHKDITMYVAGNKNVLPS